MTRTDWLRSQRSSKQPMLTALFIIVTVTSLTSVLFSGGSRILLRGEGAFVLGKDIKTPKASGLGHPSPNKKWFLLCWKRHILLHFHQHWTILICSVTINRNTVSVTFTVARPMWRCVTYWLSVSRPWSNGTCSRADIVASSMCAYDCAQLQHTRF